MSSMVSVSTMSPAMALAPWLELKLASARSRPARFEIIAWVTVTLSTRFSATLRLATLTL